MSKGTYRGTVKGTNPGSHQGLMSGSVKGTINNNPPSRTVFLEQPEARDYYNRLVARGVTMSAEDFQRVNNLVYTLKNTKGRDGVTSYWNSLDSLRLPGFAKFEYLENLIRRDFRASIVVDYTGSYTQWVGPSGNGTSFQMGSGINPTTTIRGSQDSFCMGLLVLDDKAGNPAQELSFLKSGGADGMFLRLKQASGTMFDMDGAINGVYTTMAANARTNPSSRCWAHIERINSTVYRIYINGYLMCEITNNSSAPANNEITEFAANVNGTISNWSALRHSIFYAGNANVEQNVLAQIINRTYLYPKNLAANAIRRRWAIFGDSTVGDENNSSTDLSDSSLIARRVAALISNPTNWLIFQNGNANREINLSNSVPSLTSILDNEILGGVNSQQLFSNYGFDKDVVVFFIGQNDFAFNNITDGTATLTAFKTVGRAVKAQGKKVIFSTVYARNAGFLNGQTVGQYNTARADYRTQVLADFNVSTGITNVWAAAPGIDYADVLMDIANDARFQNSGDTTYYESDQIHLKAAGFIALTDDFIIPASQYV